MWCNISTTYKQRYKSNYSIKWTVYTYSNVFIREIISIDITDMVADVLYRGIGPVVLSSCSRKQLPVEAHPWEAESRIQKYNRIWFQLCRLNIVSQQLFLILLWLMILKPVFHLHFSIIPFFVNKSPFITFIVSSDNIGYKKMHSLIL